MSRAPRILRAFVLVVAALAVAFCSTPRAAEIGRQTRRSERGVCGSTERVLVRAAGARAVERATESRTTDTRSTEHAAGGETRRWNLRCCRRPAACGPSLTCCYSICSPSTRSYTPMSLTVAVGSTCRTCPTRGATTDERTGSRAKFSECAARPVERGRPKRVRNR